VIDDHIDEYNEDRTTWARFNHDRTLRTRLSRSLTGEPVQAIPRAQTLVFCMLNPSTATAFKIDNTIERCVGFGALWGVSAVEVVNIFAWRSKDPKELYKRAHGMRGDDAESTDQVIMACTGAWMVIAAWGKHGKLGRRGSIIRETLGSRGIRLHQLGLNLDGSPKHPLYLKGSVAPQEWNGL
jgi:hypothetical protein